jgi:hypothetical protein
VNPKSLFELGVRLYGLYVLDVFIVETVTILNILLGNYFPSKESTGGFVIYAFSRLVMGIFLLFKPEVLSSLVFKPET